MAKTDNTYYVRDKPSFISRPSIFCQQRTLWQSFVVNVNTEKYWHGKGRDDIIFIFTT